MAEKILINGKATSEISPLDRGLQYGDGVFETINIQHNELLCWNEHLNRLASGCSRLNISCPDSAQLKQEALSLIENRAQAVLKIIITRGIGGRGYTLPPSPQPNRIVSIHPFPDYPEENATKGISLRVCDYRYAKNPVLAGIKHLNRLEQVIARSEWSDTSTAEGLVLDQDDNVIEGTMSNVFIIKNNVLSTPDLTECGVDGIIRNKIIELSPSLKIASNVKNVALDELMNADEMFVCNSVIGIWSVTNIESKAEVKQLPVGEKTLQIKQCLQDNHCIAS